MVVDRGVGTGRVAKVDWYTTANEARRFEVRDMSAANNASADASGKSGMSPPWNVPPPMHSLSMAKRQQCNAELTETLE